MGIIAIIYLVIAYFVTMELEERELTKRFGIQYRKYKMRVPKFSLNFTAEKQLIRFVGEKKPFTFPRVAATALSQTKRQVHSFSGSQDADHLQNARTSLRIAI